jgi:hypothetical protein
VGGDNLLAKNRQPGVPGAPQTVLTEAFFGNANAAIVGEANSSGDLSCIDAISVITTSFKNLEWGDRERFRSALAQYPQATSELTFVNLYAWTSIQYPRWGEFNDHILVSYDPGTTGVSSTFLPPIGSDPVGTMVTLHKRFGASFERVPEHLLQQLPEGVVWELKAKDHDYLYTPDQIKNLSGGPASELRRRLSKFHRTHNEAVTVLPLTHDNLGDARKVSGAWLEERLVACQSEAEKEGKREDALACSRILNKWSELSELRGSVTYVNREPVSFAIGELIPHPQYSAGALVSHFEKSVLRKDLEGLPVHCFQSLCGELSRDVVVNRMQDAGVSGLQKWKQSWGPFGQGKKGRIG